MSGQCPPRREKCRLGGEFDGSATMTEARAPLMTLGAPPPTPRPGEIERLLFQIACNRFSMTRPI